MHTTYLPYKNRTIYTKHSEQLHTAAKKNKDTNKMSPANFQQKDMDLQRTDNQLSSHTEFCLLLLLFICSLVEEAVRSSGYVDTMTNT
jgi:hypothetical protein